MSISRRRRTLVVAIPVVVVASMIILGAAATGRTELTVQDAPAVASLLLRPSELDSNICVSL